MSVATRFFQLLCNKAIPVSSTGMTPFAVQFTFTNEFSYSCAPGTALHYW
ncbi:hypothetical protein OZD61_03880 [Wolbachia endosymbiont of Drosophila bocki]|nr:hypothetical protein [Wolbachia endosymbiont of Drosophila bocki]